MMFDGLYQDQADQALNAKAMRPPEPDPNARRFSVWGTLGAAPKGVAAGSAQALASTADLSKGTTENWLGGINSPLGRIPIFSAVQALAKTGMDVLNPTEGKYTSEVGTSLRNVAQDYTPDAQTTHVAESAVFNLFRVGSKAITAAATMGNIPGAVLAGSEEGFSQADDLARQGVDINTRTKVGAVTAATNAVGFALPAAGKTWLQTGALALAGGPVSFMAQNAATREILQNADYTKLADQFDPFDPVGLTLSTVVPLGFGVMAMRGAKGKAAPAPDAPPKVAPPDDVVDAARVTLVRQQMDAANPVPERMDMADAHVTAYTQAMDQMAAGERVQVADIAPADAPKITEWAATVAKAADEAQVSGKTITFSDETIGAHSGQTDNILKATANGKEVGSIEYTVFNGSPQISMISVADGFQRKGIATELVKQLQRTFPDAEIDWGMMTKDGTALKNSLKSIEVKDPEIAAKQAELDAAIAERTAFEQQAKQFDVENLTDSQRQQRAEFFARVGDRWNELHDKIDALQSELADAKPSKILIDTGATATPKATDAAKPRAEPAAAAFNPAALADQATGLLAGGKTADQVIGELEATGAKAPPELQNMVIGVAEFGGRVNDLVEQVKALQAQRGANAQGFDLIAEAVDNLRSGRTVEAKAPADPLEKALADMSVRNPTALDAEIPIDFDADGKPGTRMTVRDYLDMVKREASQDAADANLIEVAATCFISGGI